MEIDKEVLEAIIEQNGNMYKICELHAGHVDSYNKKLLVMFIAVLVALTFIMGIFVCQYFNTAYEYPDMTITQEQGVTK